MLLDFGQPTPGIIQFAYVVPDLDQAMAAYTATLKVGPWFRAESYRVAEAMYRGAPTTMTMSLAIGFTGHMSIELIQQRDGQPSVYQELVTKSGYGFHHWGVATHDFDRDLAAYRALGWEVAFSGLSPRGIRLAYLDSMGTLPGMVELIEFSEAQERFYTAAYKASLDWDGSDPVRRF